MACVGLLDDAQVKVCSSLGWCHVTIDQGLEFSFPEEVFFVIVVVLAEKLRIKRLEAGVL